MAGPISEAFVEVGADLRPFTRQMKDGLDRSFAQVGKVASSAERTIAQAFARASSQARRNLDALGKTDAFGRVAADGGKSANSLAEAFGVAAGSVEGDLAEIGGAEVWGSLADEASRAASSLAPPFAQASADIDRALSGAGAGDPFAPLVGQAPRAGSATGEGFGSGFRTRATSAISSAAGEIGDLLTSSLQAAGVLAGGLFSGALIGGFGRLKSIDDAQGKLKGLGHEAEAIEEIMGSALDSVRGTAFGLGDAAGLSATAVAAGVEQGEELTDYLTLIADTATIAGGSLGEIGGILNKMTTSGKVYTMELNQLADRGLPVFTWLSEAYGKTSEEMRDMVSKGEVSAEEFQKILQENIGGAAQASGETFSGGLANTKAAMSRLGATFLEPFFTGTKGAFPALIGVFDSLSAALGPAMEKIAESPAFEAFFDFLGQLPAMIEGFDFSKLEDFKGLLGPLGGLLASVGSSALGSIPLIGGLIPGIGPLVGIFGGLIATSPELRDVFKDTFGSIMEAAAPLMESLPGILEGVLPPLVEFVEMFMGVVEKLVPVLAPLIETLLELAVVVLGSLLEAVTPIIEALGEVLPPIVEALTPAFEALAPVIETVGAVLGGVVGRAVEGLAPIIVVLAEAFADLVTQLAPLITQFIENLEPVLPSLVDAMLEMATAVGDVLIAVMPLVPPLTALALLLVEKIGVPILVKMAQTFAQIGTVIARLTEAVVNFMTSAASKIEAFFGEGGPRKLVERFRDGLSDLGETVTGIAESIGRFFSDLPTKVGTAIGEVLSFILNLPLRLAEGLVALPGALADFLTGPVSGAVGEVVDLLTGIPGELAKLPGMVIAKGGEMLSAAAEWSGNFLQGLLDGVGALMEGAGDLVSSLLSVLKSAWNGLVGFINDAWNAVEIKLSAFGASITIGLPDNTPNDYLKLARGANVDSPTFALLGDATYGNRRETVLPHNDPARAVQLAREGGLLDVLARGGLFDSAAAGGGLAITVENMNLSAQKSPLAHAMEMLEETSTAAWLKGVRV